MLDYKQTYFAQWQFVTLIFAAKSTADDKLYSYQHVHCRSIIANVSQAIKNKSIILPLIKIAVYHI